MSEIQSPPPEPKQAVFTEALRATLALPGVWILLGVVLALPPLAIASGWLDWLRDATAHRYEPGRLVANLDAVFRHDHSAGLESLRTGTGSAVAILGFVYVLIGIFRAGGWLQVFLERHRRRPLRRFFFGGGRYFFRFFRLWLLVLVLLGLVSWILHDLPWQRLVDQSLLGLRDSDLESLASERTVVWREWARAVAGFVALGLVLSWAVYARARMALVDGSSALGAGLLTALSILRHPVRMLAPLLALFLTEAFVLALLTVAARFTDRAITADSSWLPVAGLFLISLVALLWRELAHGARYAAAARVSAELIRKPARPDDPKSLGGPGGPRYPLDDEDDAYGVSL